MNGTYKELPYGNIALPLGSDSFHSAKVGHYTTRARVFPGCNSSLRRYPSVMKKKTTPFGCVVVFSASPCFLT